MSTLRKYQHTIESHKDYYSLSDESDYILVITIDPYMLNDIARRNATYHQIVHVVNGYFESKNIETLIVPAVVGRGATGGGFNLIYFFASNFETILAVGKHALLTIGFIRKLNDYRKRRKHNKNHRRYANHNPIVPVSLTAVLKKDKAYQHTQSNYDSIVYLLNVLPGLNELLALKYNFITFRFNLTALVEDSKSSYSVSLGDLRPTISVSGEVFKRIDKQYISDLDSANHTFSQSKFGIKHKKIVKLSADTHL